MQKIINGRWDKSIFIHDKKQALMTVMAKRGEKGGPREVGPAPMKTEVMKSEGGEIDGRHEAAQDMIAAFHEKSPEKVMRAMGNFVDLHMSMPQEETEDDGSSSSD